MTRYTFITLSCFFLILEQGCKSLNENKGVRDSQESDIMSKAQPAMLEEVIYCWPNASKIDSRCGLDKYCEFIKSYQDTGVCLDVKGENSSCEVSGECALGLVCRYENPNEFIILGKAKLCRPRPKLGEKCKFNANDCISPLECKKPKDAILWGIVADPICTQPSQSHSGN